MKCLNVFLKWICWPSVQIHWEVQHPSKQHGEKERTGGKEEKKCLAAPCRGFWNRTHSCFGLCARWHQFCCSSGMIERNWQSLPQILINEFIHLLTYLLNPFFFQFFSDKPVGLHRYMWPKLLKVSGRLACEVRRTWLLSLMVPAFHILLNRTRHQLGESLLNLLPCERSTPPHQEAAEAGSMIFLFFFLLAATSHSRPRAQLTVAITTQPQRRSHVRLVASVWRLSLSDVNHVLRSGKRRPRTETENKGANYSPLPSHDF